MQLELKEQTIQKILQALSKFPYCEVAEEIKEIIDQMTKPCAPPQL